MFQVYRAIGGRLLHNHLLYIAHRKATALHIAGEGLMYYDIMYRYFYNVIIKIFNQKIQTTTNIFTFIK
jgi:hypothetical protein